MPPTIHGNMSGKNGISMDKTVFLSLLAGETRLCPDKSPMLRRANAHQLPVGRGHCLTKARCSLCRRGHKPNTCDNSGGRQCADRQAYDGFTCRPGGTGKTFNSLCTTMLSATATVRASASVSSCYTRHRMPSAPLLCRPRLLSASMAQKVNPPISARRRSWCPLSR